MKLKIFSSALALATLGLLTAGAYAQTPATPAPAPTELVYTPQLPTVASLMDGAKAQGITVAKVTQTSTDVTVVYQYPNGQTNTVSYEVLPAGGAPATAVAPATAATTTVVYTAPGPYYYDPYYYGGYYPWGWYAPVGIRIGIGGGWGGGWHGGWRR